MKKLYLVRHAKSSWTQSGISDFERPLNERGNRDKIEMGKRLREKQLGIELILSSSAKRTKQTSIALSKELSIDTKDIQFEDTLYHASVVAMLDTINKADSSIDSLMLVGHNPGISLLCDYLCGYAADFPTLGIACITFEVDSWKEVSNNMGTLKWFDYPKSNK